MEPRVTFKDGIIGFSHDWEHFVIEPARNGYFQEAFASADAIIDNLIEAMLRMLYSDFKCQDLIGQLHALHGRTNFDGLAIVLVLQNKGVFPKKSSFYDRVLDFKKDRNLVCHNPEGHYALIAPTVLATIKTQEDFDSAATSAVNTSLAAAHTILTDLYDKFHEINGHVEDFFGQKQPIVKNGKAVVPKKNS